MLYLPTCKVNFSWDQGRYTVNIPYSRGSYIQHIFGPKNYMDRHPNAWDFQGNPHPMGSMSRKQTAFKQIGIIKGSWWFIIPGYFRLICARTGRFDLRYDSGVWFGGMIRGMIRGYDSRVRRKPSYQRELSLEPKLYRPCALPTALTLATLGRLGMIRLWFGYDSGMIQ